MFLSIIHNNKKKNQETTKMATNRKLHCDIFIQYNIVYRNIKEL